MTTRVMKTETATELAEAAEAAGKLLAAGEIAAIPTETVYGLAASIYCDDAIRRIFAVKGRPQDNPLIVHITKKEQIKPLVTEVTPLAEKLADMFWPGPLTIIFPKSEMIHDSVSAGLDTVAIRMPSHPVARAVIDAAGCPLAAPSANLSGKPSTTSAEHCFHDLNGKIPLIIDGGECDVGLESTVVSVKENTITVLRPGGITPEMLSKTGAEIKVAEAVLHPLKAGEKPLSPGMAHKHYSPNAKVLLISGGKEKRYKFAETYVGKNAACICFDDQPLPDGVGRISMGVTFEGGQKAHHIFDALRRADELNYSYAIITLEDESGIGMAINNRLLRAAEFEVIKL